MSLTPGTRIGPYDVTALLGEGGMGAVYRARDTKLQRDVALKVLLPGVTNDPERLGRFRREAQTLAALNHPHIGAIYGLEESDPSTGSGQAGTIALVLELVDGPTLADRIARGAIPVDEALPIAKQIADALEAAHEYGIIHRDLKPANIKVRADGTVKVLDFGLAKAMEQGSAIRGQGSAHLVNSPTITTPAMTQAGMILGTAAYMAPEQARGKAVDRRADIWAFGAVLFEMITGQRAFPGEDLTDTLAAVVKLDPKWDALAADVPARVRQVLRACLQKDPKQRMGDMQSVRLALEGAFDTAVSSAPVVAPAPPLSLWRRVLPVAFTIVACALVGSAAWRFRPEPPLPLVSRSSFLLPAGQTWNDAGGPMLAVSPDGARLVYAADGRLYRRDLSDLEATPIPGTEGAVAPVFSPDGQSLAFFAGDGIKRMPLTGGAAVTLCPATPPNDITWESDGIVFVQNGVGILRVSPSGGTPEVVVTLKDDEFANAAQILPGGTHVLMSLATGTEQNRWDRANVVVQAVGAEARTVLVEGASTARYVSTGHLLYARGGNLHAVPFDARRLQVGTGGTEPVVQGVRRFSRRIARAQFAVSDSGTLLFVPGPATATVMASRPTSAVAVSDATGKVTPLKLPPGPYQRPRVSPDGARLAVGVEDGQDTYIAIYDLHERSALRRLTFGSRDRWPIWSRDSQRVTFTSDRDGSGSQLFWQRADGVGPAERLTTSGASGKVPVANSWSPGDATLLFEVIETNASPPRSLWTYSREDRKESPFAAVQSRQVIEAAFSPDGHWVAYGANAGTATSVYVQPFPTTGALYQVPGSLLLPIWSPDGKALFYRTTPGPWARVSVTTQPAVAFGNPIAVPVPVSPVSQQVDRLPDGRFLILQPVQEAGETTAPEIRIVLNWHEELKRLVPAK